VKGDILPFEARESVMTDHKFRVCCGSREFIPFQIASGLPPGFVDRKMCTLARSLGSK
jgi:hypothetical protein